VQGEIIWIESDPQSGHRQTNRHPALVISETAYNLRIGRVFVCPITSNAKGYPFELPIQTKPVNGVVLSDHFKNLDWQARSTTYAGEYVSATELQKVWLLIGGVVGLS
jgi:mRNA interferase MazF